MADYDPVREFEDTLILRQGELGGFILRPPKVALLFRFPKCFEIHFTRVEDYRVDLPISMGLPVKGWSARRESEYLNSFFDEVRRNQLTQRDLSSLCHFRVEFQQGHLDVLADDAVFMIVAR